MSVPSQPRVCPENPDIRRRTPPWAFWQLMRYFALCVDFNYDRFSNSPGSSG
jgi:hypothetical protein